jgi:fibronectin-binding autotransporter adhesin
MEKFLPINSISMQKMRTINRLFLAIMFLALSFPSSAANYYSFADGDWAVAGTWTQDPTGLTSVAPAVPGATDAIFIINGRTVFTTVSRTVVSSNITNLSTLDLGSAIGHNLGTVTGQGTLVISAGTFPSGTFTSFVSAGGGTIEYRNINGTLPAQQTFNNLKISNTSSSSVTSTLSAGSNPTNYVVNGDLDIIATGSGVLEFNLGSVASNIINLNVETDISVSSNAVFGVSLVNAIHNVTLKGNFLNSGTVNFSNSAQYTASTNGAANLTFTSPVNAIFDINGVTNVYTLTVNKGVDFNSELEMVSSNVSYFNLYSNSDALILVAGTLKWGNNMSQTRVNGGGLFVIPVSSRLWISGGDMLLNGNVGGVLVNGIYKITSGNFSAGFEGMLFGLNGSVLIEGGITTLEKLRPVTTAGAHTGSLTMIGGTLTVDGSTIGSGDTGSPRFSIPYPDMSFFVSGGVINVGNPEAGAAANGGIFIGVNASNSVVTAGVINVSLSGTGANFNISSTVPLFSVVVTKTSAGPATVTLGPQVFGSSYNQAYFTTPAAGNELVLIRDFTLTSGNDPEFVANAFNVSIGRNFTISTGTTYNPGTNTTTFNGTGTQQFLNNGFIIGGLYNLTVSKSFGQTLLMSGSVTSFNIVNNLTLTLGTINTGGKQILCNGDLFVGGTCLGAGAIQLVGTGLQTISGTGSGIFTNLTLNKATGSTTMTANFQISGALRLANSAAVLNIGSKVLFFTAASKIYDALTGTTSTNFSSTRMISTDGAFSDGGVRKNYNGANKSFLYAFGSSGKYTPASITITGNPTTYGFIIIRPVNQRHPIATSDEAIPYYWKTNSTGFVLGSAQCNHVYRYADSDVVLFSPATEADYVPAKFSPSLVEWSVGLDSEVIEATNSVNITPASFGGGIDGEYTCGAQIPNDPFSTVITFYSIRDGVWEDTAIATTPWSVRAHNDIPAGIAPGPGNPVRIGDGISFFHTITSGANGEKSGYLFLGQGSTLDVGITVNHNFSVANGIGVSGSGLMKVSSSSSTASFPGGDFGIFLSSTGGNVEYYTTSVSFTMPTATGAPFFQSLNTYNNLTISPGTGLIITMPDIDISVLKTFKVNGSSVAPAGIVRHNQNNPRQLIVNGAFMIDSGDLVFANNSPQTVIANSNLIISNTGVYRVNGAGSVVNNSLTLKANLTNNGIFDMQESGRVCDVIFQGNANRQIGGTNAASVTEFNKLTIDKGPAAERTLDVTVAGSFTTPSDNWLTMLYGGLRISRPVNLTLTNSSTAFSLPSNTQLTLNHPSAEVLVGQSASNSADFILGGKLVLIDGSLKVGLAGSNNNQDIEYSSAGDPEIDIRNGSTLFVNGQIRRSLGTIAGGLIYKQSGTSVVEIVGADANTNRAKFEIVNPSSVFNLSDNANIIMRTGGGAPFADVFLQPGSSTISGGTLSFITQNIDANQEFLVESSVPLNSILVQGFDANDQANVKLFSSALTLDGSLTIANDHSSFNADGKTVTINGNLVNNNGSSASGLSSGGYRPSVSTQLTQFTSASVNQTISGVAGNLTNFANLKILNSAPSGTISLSPNTALQVNNTLSIHNGTLVDGGNSITCLGDIINNSVHQSTGGGSIICAGASTQVISGNGSGIFGKLTINNSNSVNTAATITINDNLNLQSGLLNISVFLLRLSENCSVSGSFSGTSMIRTNGNAVDSGVMKMFPSGTANFEFPVGTSVNYTPASFDITSNSATGTIRVVPVESKHPATTLAADEQLNYFWSVQSTGFSGLVVNHRYQYLDAFVTGTETNYVTGRYLLPQWSPLGGIAGTVNTTTNRMELNAVNFIQGEYTCGAPTEFQQIDTLYSRDATLGGPWDDLNTWSFAGHSGPSAGVIPTSQVVIVKNGHTVNTNGDNRTCSVLKVDGIVDAEDDNLIDFGFCEGTGRIKIASNGSAFNFPAGNFNSFNSIGGGTTEYYGSVSGILSNSPFYNNLEFSGNSTKTMGNVPFIVNGNLSINDGIFKTDVFNQNLTVLGNWNNNVGSSGFVSGQNNVIFNGGAQTIGGTGATHFYNVEFANSATKTLGNNITVNNDLFINPGVTLDVSASNFNIQLKHDWVNNGSFNAREGTVDLNGSTLQTLLGSSVTEFFNLTQNNVFDVTLGTDQSLKNTLNVQAGDFITTPRTFTLLSDLTRTGRIAPLFSGNVQGNISQQRLVPGPTTGWAVIGAPVSGQTISQWTDDFPTSGFIGSTGNAGNFISMYTYDEGDLGAFGAPSAYVPITNAGVDPLLPGVGYWTFLGTGLTTTANILIDAEGPVVKGEFNFNPSFTSSGSLPNDGWNLVANPYPSAIDWNAASGWTKTNMDNAIYLYNADGAQYAAWVSGVSVNGGVSEIGSSQGFYVKANAAGARLSCTESVKSAANPTFLRQGRNSSSSSSELFRMTLLGNGKADEAVVRFLPDASGKYDGMYDAYKWNATNNSIASVSTIAGDDNLSINSLPQDFASISVPVKILAGIEGNYELSFQGIESLSGLACVVIEDLKSGQITDLKSIDKLNFQSEAGREEPRFLIHLERGVQATAIAASCNNIADGSISIEGIGGRQIAVIDESGVEIAAVSGKSSLMIPHLKSGVYKLTSSGSACGTTSQEISLTSGSVASGLPSFELGENGNYAFAISAPAGAEVVWSIEGENLSGAMVNHRFSGAGEQEVSVTIKDGACVETRSFLMSVENAGAEQGFTVGPDGSGNHLLAVSGYQGTIRIEILNAAGQLVSSVFQGNVASGARITLNTSSLSEGIYLVRINAENGTVTRKIQR